MCAYSKAKKSNNKRGSVVPAGFCFCRKCGEFVPHKDGIRCNLVKCPKCGARKLIESQWQTQL